jgi:hypothetical protein
MISYEEFRKALAENGESDEAALSQLYEQTVETRKACARQGKRTQSLVSFHGKAPWIAPDTAAGIVKYGKPFLDSLFISNADLAEQKKAFSLDDPKEVEVFISGGMEGIDFDLYQERVLGAVLSRFTDDGFPEWVTLKERDLYARAGAEQVQTKRGRLIYPGRESLKLRRALAGFARTNYPVMIKTFEKYDPKRKQNLYNLEGAFRPLMDVRWVYRSVEENELKEYRDAVTFSDGGLSYRFAHWKIKLSPAVLAGIQKSFRLIPCDVYRQIKDHKGARVTKAEVLFIKWLHKHGMGKTEIRINWLNLADNLKFGADLRHKDFRAVRATITRLYELAQALGYIERFQASLPSERTEDRTVDVIYLNPRRFHHLKGLPPS